MNLKLDDVVVPHDEYPGRNIDQMPLLVKDNRVPISVAGLMQRRLEVLKPGFSQEVRDNWWNSYFDTGDAPAYHPDGRVKVVLDADDLRTMNSQSALLKDGLLLPEGRYENLSGLELTAGEIKKYGRLMNREQAREDPVWTFLARDTGLLVAYVDSVFYLAKQRYGYDEAMGIYFGQTQEKPIMRLWCVSDLDCRSSVDGDVSLVPSCGRLVGVRRPDVAEGDEQKS